MQLRLIHRPYVLLLIAGLTLISCKIDAEAGPLQPNPDIPKFAPDRIQVRTTQGTPTDIVLTNSGTDYIGLSPNDTQTFTLQFVFDPANVPLSIQPNPQVPRDYRQEQTFTIVFSPEVIKKFTVKIAPHPLSTLACTPFKGVWLTNVGSDALYSKKGIAECVELCAELGISTIFMVVYNDGKTMYPSQVMQDYFGVPIDPDFAGRDPLAELLALAKPKNIRVIPWFEYGFASVYNDTSGGAILLKYPSWASRDAEGHITQKNNFYWLDAFNPDVQQFLRKLIVEVATSYPDIAGIQGDDRLPALPSHGGYNTAVLEQYRTETKRATPTSPTDPHWLQWRADQLSHFGEYIYKHIKAINPNYIVSMSPSPFDWSLQNYLQDWPTWIQKNQVDLIHPQLYRSSFEAYKRAVDSNYPLVQAWPCRDMRFNPGVLIGTGAGEAITPEILDQILAYNRSLGIQGETYFYYERIKQNKDFQEVIKKY